jgi:tetratricopeptide (TPR) repeat protein
MRSSRTKKSKLANTDSSSSQSGSLSLSATEFFTERRALFLIIAGTWLVYANSLSGAFVFDDTKQIVGNPQLHTWANIVQAFTNDVWSFQRATLTTDIPLPYYRPLFTVYLTLNYQAFGLWEPGWHLMNLLVHTVATVLVYFLLKKLSGDRFIAILGSLLFGLHPAHVESVSWISGIPDPLSTLFYVPALLWYIRFREDGGWQWLAASLVAYGLSALCKETPLALPLVLGVWELSRAQSARSWADRLKNIIRQLTPYAIVAAGYLALRFSVLGNISWRHPFTARVPDSDIWMTVPFVIVNYLKHLVAPFYLSLIYGISFITSASDPRFFVSAGFLLVLSYVLWIYRKKLDADIWMALALIIAPLLPVLNLRVFHSEYIIQDRYLYLPSIGFCYLIATLIVRLSRTQMSLAAGLSGIIVLAFGISTILQNRIWHNSVALWQRAAYTSPSSWSTHYNLGLAYIGVKQYTPAETELLESRRLNPKQAVVYNNLAMAQAGLGNLDGAIANSKSALSLDSGLLEAHNNLGAFLYDRQDYSGAKQEFLTVLERDPGSNSARFNLGRTLAAMGDQAGAIRELERAVAIKPDDGEAHYQLGLSYAAVGRKSDAVREIQRALSYQHDPQTARNIQQKLEEIERAQ